MSSLRSNSVNGNCNFANQETPKTRDAETRRRGFDFTFTRDLQISENTQVEAPTDLSAIDQLIKNSHRVLFNGTLGHKMITKPEGEANSVVTQCHLCQKVIRSLVKLHTKEKTEEQVPKDFVYPMYKNLMTRKEVNEPPNQNTLKFQENILPRTPHIPPRTQPNSTVFGNPMRAQVNTSLFSTSTQVPSSKAPGFSTSTKMPDVTSSSTPGSGGCVNVGGTQGGPNRKSEDPCQEIEMRHQSEMPKCNTELNEEIRERHFPEGTGVGNEGKRPEDNLLKRVSELTKAIEALTPPLLPPPVLTEEATGEESTDLTCAMCYSSFSVQGWRCSLCLDYWNKYKWELLSPNKPTLLPTIKWLRKYEREANQRGYNPWRKGRVRPSRSRYRVPTNDETTGTR